MRFSPQFLIKNIGKGFIAVKLIIFHLLEQKSTYCPHLKEIKEILLFKMTVHKYKE